MSVKKKKVQVFSPLLALVELRRSREIWLPRETQLGSADSFVL